MTTARPSVTNVSSADYSGAGAKAITRTLAHSVAIDYLRALVVFLVVVYHSTLAYLPYVPAPAQAFVGGLELWRAFPVVDSQRSIVAGLFLLVCDTFFMALMFFVSGLFVWPSLERKGALSFLRDRILRLGIPFLFGVCVILPVAHYASYLQWSQRPDLAAYWRAWWSLSYWPSGPMWFISMLLAFDAIAAGLFAVFPRWGERLAALASVPERHPMRFLAVVLILSAFAYLPLSLAFGGATWTHWGWFQFQTSRPLHYFIYFLMGVAVGANGLQRGLLSRGGELARRWLLWALAAVACGALFAFLAVATLPSNEPAQPIVIYSSGPAFVATCATWCFALLAVFTRFVQRSHPIFDSLAANSYGIFIVHFALVAWLRLALLPVSLSGVEKWGLVAIAAYLASWLATAAARQLAFVARIV